eukprot:3907375-Prymnesium_polylepis.1
MRTSRHALHRHNMLSAHDKAEWRTGRDAARVRRPAKYSGGCRNHLAPTALGLHPVGPHGKTIQKMDGPRRRHARLTP